MISPPFYFNYREGYLQKSSIFLLVPEMKKAEDISITRLDGYYYIV